MLEKFVARLLVALVGGVALASCVVEPEDGSTSRSGSARDFGQVLSSSFDYDEVDRTELLAENSTAVVRASITSIQAGRSYAFVRGDRQPYMSAVVEFDVTELVQGDLGQSQTDRVFIEVEPDGGWGSTDLATPLPVGAPALLYLYPASNQESDSGLLDESAGRPAGYRLFVASVQGFLIEERGSVVSVLTREEFPGENLRNFEPDAGILPEGIPLEPSPEEPAS